MKRHLFNFLVCLAICLFQRVTAQPDTMVLAPGFKQLAANPYLKHFATATHHAPESAWNVFTAHPDSVTTLRKIHLGPTTGFHWLTLSVKNNSGEAQNLYLEIRQPHLMHVAFYRVVKDSIKLLYETGINYNFFTRPVDNRFFDFPINLKPGQDYTALLMVEQVNSLSLPVYIITEQALLHNIYRQNLAWGFWFGFLAFCALYALMAAILLRKGIFLWYFFYISTAAVYGIVEVGYGFQFLFPNKANLAAPVIVHLTTYVYVLFIKFSQSLLETKKRLLVVHKILNSICYFLLALVVGGWVMNDAMIRYSPYFLPVAYVIMPTGLFLLAFCGIRTLATNRLIGIFYVIAYGQFMVACFISILAYAFAQIQYNGPNPVLIAFFIEAVLLSLALVILYRQVQLEKTTLSVQLASQQRNLYQTYIDGVEKERSRIAGELHDDIGSKLSYIKQSISMKRENNDEWSGRLDSLIQDVRRLSHDLAPPVAHVSGLRPLVEQLILETRKVSSIDFDASFYDYEEKFGPAEIQQLYRIVQEAIHNITEHSKATRADIQFFGQEDGLHIVIEDDGVGFAMRQNYSGIGLNQMKIRTESLKGHIEVSGRPGFGTHILVEVPYT